MCAFCGKPGCETCEECRANICKDHAYYVDRDGKTVTVCKDCK